MTEDCRKRAGGALRAGGRPGSTCLPRAELSGLEHILNRQTCLNANVFFLLNSESPVTIMLIPAEGSMQACGWAAGSSVQACGIGPRLGFYRQVHGRAPQHTALSAGIDRTFFLSSRGPKTTPSLARCTPGA